jgi:coenzyme F420-0:L-glutamate ligase/coenzyme F420-1:gamma-L-glutamate ligase
VAGIAPLVDYRGKRDAGGRTLQATVIARADELAAAAELVMGKTDRVPVAIVRGVASGEKSGSGRDLIRPAATDIFR